MSVPFGKRSKNPFQAEKDLREVVIYTIKMCENEKIFPKKCRWALCNRIIDNCINALTNIRNANETDMSKSTALAEYRINKEYDLLDNISNLWQLMTIAKECYSIPNDKIQTWSDKMYKADCTVRSWHRSDVKKFNELKNK